MKNKLTYSLLIIIVLVILNVITGLFPIRWDLTADKRHTLSETTKKLISEIDENIIVNIYLEGDFPLDFTRLQQATKQHLDELKSHNSHIHYRFINPIGQEEKLIKKGLQPSRLTIEENGSIAESIIFPWAEIKYNNKTQFIPLLINTGNSQKNQLQASIENLEYAFSEGISQLLTHKRKSIAILKGNGELEDIYLYDLLTTIKKKHNLAPFVLSKENINPITILNDLIKYDLAIIAKPTKAFSEEEKLILDQYITNGGKTLWMLDTAVAEMDSLQQKGEALFFPRDLNLTDLLFSYGVRVNSDLVSDLYSSKIALATGNMGDKTQYQQFLWHYYPLVSPNSYHAISKKTEAVHLKFPTSIDTLPNNIHKDILLQSSPLTKTTGLPNIISLLSISEKIKPENYNHKPQILGVLLEGKFTSAYNHRTRAFQSEFKETSPNTKMIIISDGDIASNQLKNGQPTRMDVDKWTGQHYGNKDFILNAVNYLLDDTGLLNLRSKTLNLVVLNKEKITKNRSFWQVINIGLPLLLLGLFGYGFDYFRRKKYQ